MAAFESVIRKIGLLIIKIWQFFVKQNIKSTDLCGLRVSSMTSWIQSNPPVPEGEIWHPRIMWQYAAGEPVEAQKSWVKQKEGTWCFLNFAGLQEFLKF